MIINHNLSSINANRVLHYKNEEVDGSMRKLASGMRITRAGDDASGLAVSEKMRSQIRGLNRAEMNAWGLSTVDVERGMIFMPLGTPNLDFYGGNGDVGRPTPVWPRHHAGGRRLFRPWRRDIRLADRNRLPASTGTPPSW